MRKGDEDSLVLNQFCSSSISWLFYSPLFSFVHCLRALILFQCANQNFSFRERIYHGNILRGYTIDDISSTIYNQCFGVLLMLICINLFPKENIILCTRFLQLGYYLGSGKLEVAHELS